jgi:hypothetical protein
MHLLSAVNLGGAKCNVPSREAIPNVNAVRRHHKCQWVGKSIQMLMAWKINTMVSKEEQGAH